MFKKYTVEEVQNLSKNDTVYSLVDATTWQTADEDLRREDFHEAVVDRIELQNDSDFYKCWFMRNRDKEAVWIGVSSIKRGYLYYKTERRNPGQRVVITSLEDRQKDTDSV